MLSRKEVLRWASSDETAPEKSAETLGAIKASCSTVLGADPGQGHITTRVISCHSARKATGQGVRPEEILLLHRAGGTIWGVHAAEKASLPTKEK